MEKQETKRGEKGFTLVELMVVIVILGILAAIVVFAVGGITNKGQDASCKTDSAILVSAEETNFAQTGSYDTVANLVTKALLHNASTLHSVTLTGAPVGSSYTIAPVAPCTVATG